jgi:hypothetical protein
LDKPIVSVTVEHTRDVKDQSKEENRGVKAEIFCVDEEGCDINGRQGNAEDVPAAEKENLLQASHPQLAGCEEIVDSLESALVVRIGGHP